ETRSDDSAGTSPEQQTMQRARRNAAEEFRDPSRSRIGMVEIERVAQHFSIAEPHLDASCSREGTPPRRLRVFIEPPDRAIRTLLEYQISETRADCSGPTSRIDHFRPSPVIGFFLIGA